MLQKKAKPNPSTVAKKIFLAAAFAVIAAATLWAGLAAAIYSPLKTKWQI